jgi:hypothetical protein
MKVFSRLRVRTKLALVMTAHRAGLARHLRPLSARLKGQAVSDRLNLAEMAAFSVGGSLPGPTVWMKRSRHQQNGDLVYVIVLDSRDQPSHRSTTALRISTTIGGFRWCNARRRQGSFGARSQKHWAGFRRRLYQTTASVRYKGRPIGRVYLGLSSTG